jgi:hypothetical protein
LLAGLPEVIEAYLTTGDYDYLVKVAVESTAGYERFLREKLYRLPGIRHSRSSFPQLFRKRKSRSDPTMPPMTTLQTMPFNVIGNPVLAIPNGFSKSDYRSACRLLDGLSTR